MNNAEKTVLTIPEVAEILRLSPARAYQLARQGMLPVVKFGKTVRVLKKELDEMLTCTTLKH